MIEKIRQLRADHLKIQHGLSFYPYQNQVSDNMIEALISNLRITSSATEKDIQNLKHHEIAIEQSRQCVAAGELVTLADGEVKSIEHIVPGDSVLSYDGMTAVSSAVDDAWSTGKKECYQVTTTGKKRVTVTNNHKFKTQEGFQSLAEGVYIGKKIAIAGPNGKIRWHVIKNIKPVGEKHTYDLTVAGTHNFVVGGIVTHNSGKTYGVAHTCEFILTFLPAIFNRPIHIGIFAAQIRQAEISYTILRNSIKKEKSTLLAGTEESGVERENARTLVLPGGSSVVISPINKTSLIEGATLDLVIIDEAQFADDEVVKHSIWPMTAACVCAGTKVYNNAGEIIDVSEVTNTILGFDEVKKELSLNTVKNFGKSSKPSVEITTNSGRKLRCSNDHPILLKLRSSRNIRWTQASDVRIGTQIAIADKIDTFGELEIEDPQIVGMLIGDGSYRYDGMVRYSGSDPELMDYIKSRYDFKVYGSHPTKDGRLYEDGTIKGMATKLREIGIYGQTGQNKKLPPDWSKFSKQTLSRLLLGIFDTDGTVNARDGRRTSINITSVSEGLIWDIFYALEKFGIHSRIKNIPSAKRTIADREVNAKRSWLLTISERQSVLRYSEEIGFTVERKKVMLEDGIYHFYTRKNKRQNNMKNLYFERVVNVEDIGEQTVYNMTADQTNTYLANGIVTHNTNGPRIYIGKAGTRINHFYRLSQRNNSLKIYFDDIVRQRRQLYEETGDARHLMYEQTVKQEIEREGEDTDHIQREYFGKWQVGTGQFITQQALDELTDKERSLTYQYKKTDCFVGIDTAKAVDDTVVTVIRDSGETVERTLPDGKTKEYAKRKDVLNWLVLKGDNYQDQFDVIKDFLSLYNVKGVAIDSTGQGDFMPDMFERHTQWQKEETGLYRVKFSAQSKDVMYKNLKASIKQGSIRLPDLEKVKYGNKFREQMLDLQQEYKGQIMSVHHPDTPEGRDDFCFAAGTRILTSEGQVNIEDVEAGMEVMTREGFAKVIAAGMTGHREVITRFGLTATPDHPIITENGVKEFADVDESELIYAWNDEASPIDEQGIIAELSDQTTNNAVHDVVDQEVPVYNLQVESYHEYFANNILVHNCDSLALAEWAFARYHERGEPQIAVISSNRDKSRDKKRKVVEDHWPGLDWVY